MARTNEELLARAKAMRSNPTPAEARLRYHLRASRLNDVKFVHQLVIDPYIADFVARSAKLIVEVDGDTHAGSEAYDERRTTWLEKQSHRVLRFTNADVMTNEPAVLAAILAALHPAPLPDPLPEGERESKKS